MEIFWHGHIFGSNGIDTAARHLCRSMERLGCRIGTSAGCKHPTADNRDCLHWIDAVDPARAQTSTITFGYPHVWPESNDRTINGFVYEGSRLFFDWIERLNQAHKLWCPSDAVRYLLQLNGVTPPTRVIPHGIVPELHRPTSGETSDPFTFLTIGSWLGERFERKGIDLLLEAFDLEFKPEEPVRLYLKASTFWVSLLENHYERAIEKVLGHLPASVIIDQSERSEKEIAALYQEADCFVTATRGEGFGLTLLEALGCGLPVIAPDDDSSGHMEFCDGNPGALLYPCRGKVSAPSGFYPDGSLLSDPDIEALRARMRWVYENRQAAREMGMEGSRQIHAGWTWQLAAEGMLEWLREG